MGKRRKLSDDPVVRACKVHGTATVMRAVTYAAAWAWVAETLGHAPTLEEYREWWNASERTTYREQSAFRAVTGLDDPAPVWERARAAGVQFDKDSASRAGGLGLLPYMHWASQ